MPLFFNSSSAQSIAGLTRTPLTYGAKGDGTTDDTTPVQLALSSGNDIFLPAGSVFKITSPLTISTAKQRLSGPGKLNFTAGITSSAALSITADGVSLDGLYLSNPNLLQAQSGGKNTGISIAASGVRVTNCLVEYFQNGIAVQPEGEFADTIIGHNRIKDCLGAGDGPANGSSTYGEDRGDGIVNWGTRALIIGNVVNCKTGQDGRIGIHCEDLRTFEVSSDAMSDAMSSVIGNTVFGKFRRSIAFEGMANCIASGNTVSGSTWWGISLHDAKSCVVSGNTLLWTRPSTDNQGSAWAPIRTPLMMMRGSAHCLMRDNTVVVSGAADAFACIQGVSSAINTACALDDNDFALSGAGAAANGIYFNNYVARPKVRRNSLEGFGSGMGVYLYGVTDPTITDNLIDGLTTGVNGIYTGSDIAGGVISRNRVRNLTGIAIAIANSTGPIVVDDNLIASCGIGFDGYGSAAGGSLRGNTYSSVTTKEQNIAGNIVRDPSIAWSAYTPNAPTAGSGTLTTASVVGRYLVIGKTVFFDLQLTVTTNGTGGNYLLTSLPIAPLRDVALVGADSGAVSVGCQAAAGAVGLYIWKYDGTYPGVAGRTIKVSGTYETA